MKYPTSLSLAALLLAGSAAAGTQDRHSIKIKELGAGDSARVEIKDVSTFKSTTSIEKQKEPKTEEHQGFKHLVYTETILLRPDPLGLPTKLVRSYEQAVHKGTGGPFGQKDRLIPYHGKSVQIEKKGSGYEFKLEDGALLNKEAPELIGEFSDDARGKSKKAFLPPGPVAAGESWKVDPKDFGIDPGKVEGAQVLKSEGLARLIKVYRLDSRLYGIIETNVELHFRALTKAPVPADAGSLEMKAVVRITFEGCIDGSLADGRMIGLAEVNSQSNQRVKDVGLITTLGRNSSQGEFTWKEIAMKK